jgi:hypothetical protein
MNGIAVVSLAMKNAVEAGAECTRLPLVEFPGRPELGLTAAPATRSAAVAAALLRLVQCTHARLAVLSIGGLGHLAAGRARVPGTLPVTDPVGAPEATYRLGGSEAWARLSEENSRRPDGLSLSNLDEPGVQAVLDFVGVMPGRPLLEPIRTRFATGCSDQLGEMALLAVADAAIAKAPRWAVSLIWTRWAPRPRSNLEAFFRCISEPVDLTPPTVGSGAPGLLILDGVSLTARATLLLDRRFDGT